MFLSQEAWINIYKHRAKRMIYLEGERGETDRFRKQKRAGFHKLV